MGICASKKVLQNDEARQRPDGLGSDAPLELAPLQPSHPQPQPPAAQIPNPPPPIDASPAKKHISAELHSYLDKVPLLKRLTVRDREALGLALGERHYNDKEVIVREGEIGREFFLLKSGKAIVTKLIAEGGSEEEKNAEGEQGSSEILGVLGVGDYFGETALLTKSRRAATVAAEGPTTVYYLDQDKFIQMFGNVTFAKRLGISAETFHSSSKRNQKSGNFDREGQMNGIVTDEKKMESNFGDDGQIREKSEETVQMILAAIKDNILFVRLNPEQRMEIVKTMYLRKVRQGEILIRQGDFGDYFYVVENGSFDIFVRKKSQSSHPQQKPPTTDKSSSSSSDGRIAEGNSVHAQENGFDFGNNQKVAARGRGQTFGELALMYNAPRAATVICTTPESFVWTVQRKIFRKVLKKLTTQKLKEYESFLATVEVFQVLTNWERMKIAEALEEISYPDGTEIVRQGDSGEVFFFILERGTVLVKKDIGDGNGERIVAKYTSGDTFGERALLTKEPRAASVIAEGPVKCLYLNQTSFETLLGPLEDVFQKRFTEYREIDNELQRTRPGSPTSVLGGGDGLSPPTSPTQLQPRQEWSRTDFTVLGTLGKGSFGHVELVRSIQNRKTYALKAVRKTQVVALGQQGHIMSEKAVMTRLKHPFLVELHGTFKDRNFLYFLLEPSLGGELFTILRRKTYFRESTAKFYAAAVVLAFEYMHSQDIIYRDLKPENLLLDEVGYLKITDFGFAKKIKDRTFTLCGTPDYLAPEVVSGQGHGKAVDWWTLGILIYEMLASYPPFYDEDPMKTYQKIMHGNLSFPVHFSKPAVDLIRRLLHPKPHKRIGIGKGGTEILKSHPWFAGLDWSAYLRKEIPAPIILPVKSEEDLSNFEDYGDDPQAEEEAQFEDYTPDPNSPDWDADF